MKKLYNCDGYNFFSFRKSLNFFNINPFSRGPEASSKSAKEGGLKNPEGVEINPDDVDRTLIVEESAKDLVDDDLLIDFTIAQNFERHGIPIYPDGILYAGNKKILKQYFDNAINNYKLGDWNEINKALFGGEITQGKVEELQKMLGFTGNDVDGKIGPKTLKKLMEYVDSL